MDSECELICGVTGSPTLLDSVIANHDVSEVPMLAVVVAQVNMALQKYPNADVSQQMRRCIIVLASQMLRHMLGDPLSMAGLEKALFDPEPIRAVLVELGHDGSFLDKEGKEEAALMFITGLANSTPKLVRRLAGRDTDLPFIDVLGRLVPVFAAAFLLDEPMAPYELAFAAMGEGSENVSFVIGTIMDAVLFEK